MTKARHGIYAAAISPLTSQLKLDRPALAAYCRYLLSEGGCDGVAPLGTTGEGPSISLRCKLGVPEAFADAGIEPDRAIIGTGCPSIKDTAELSRAALQAGYVNVLVLPPYYYKNVGDDGLFEFYSRVIAEVNDSRLRLYLYHFPQMSATPLSTQLVVRLIAAYGETMAGLKDSSGDFRQSLAFVRATGGIARNFDIFPSSEAFLEDGLKAGCAGVISGSTNSFGKLARRTLERESPDLPRRIELANAAREFAMQFPLVPAMKRHEALRSGNPNWLRLLPPLEGLTKDQAEQFDLGLAELRRRTA
ncbi:MAG: dihydrodipicolinate synthase family protein [Rhodobacteraceae bacterium]|nr:dihydrodipicolinate synthase family protein [Paracoccaceae bacterium]